MVFISVHFDRFNFFHSDLFIITRKMNRGLCFQILKFEASF